MDVSGRKPHIIVIDDEPIIRELVEDILTESGCMVTGMSSGEEGIEYYRTRANEIDVVLLDIIMPGMNGPEVFKTLREINPDVQVIFLSGYSRDSDLETLLSHVNVDFIQKPLSMKVLLEKIEERL